MRHSARFVPVLLVPVLVAFGCGGGNKVSSHGGTNGTVSGVVVQAPVAGAVVTAYQLNPDMSRAGSLATTTTSDGSSGGAAGTFQLDVGGYNGPLEVVASGGSYSDEATGATMSANGYEVSAPLGFFQAGSSVSITVSPISSIAAALARHDVTVNGTSLRAAVDAAYTHVNSHFGGVDWRTVVPAALGAGAVTSWIDPVTAAVVLAGLSQEAHAISVLLGGPSSVVVSPAVLTHALYQDALAGLLDGIGPSGTVTVGTGSATWSLNGSTSRLFLAQSILAYAQSHTSQLGSVTTAVDSLATTIAGDSDPYLFSTPGSALNLSAPIVSLLSPGSGPGPYYTNQASISVAAAVTDMGNGVAGAYAVLQAGTTIAGTRCDSTTSPSCTTPQWAFMLTGLGTGTNTVHIYAVDDVGQGGNVSCVDAGSSTTANCITLTVVLDTATPSVVIGGGTYYDEQYMTVGPSAPPVYTFPDPTSAACTGGSPLPGCTPTTVVANTTIRKAASRLAPGATPGPGALEGTNPDNLPWLKITASPSGAPIKTATYAIVASVGTASTTYQGDLMPWMSPTSDPRSTQQSVVFDLPLDVVRIPGLATTIGSVGVSVNATVTDAAGNVAPAASSGQLTYSVVGPPLSIVQDQNYPWALDLKSTFPYPIADGSYADLWADTQRFQAGQVRLVRYVVSNPTPYYVALSPAFVGTSPTPSADGWSLTEHHSRYIDTYWSYPPVGCVPSYSSYACDLGGCFLDYAHLQGTVSIKSSITGLTTSCDATKNICGHRVGSLTCIEPLAPATWTDAPGTAAVSLLAYQNPVDTGGETAPAAQVGSLILVPPATGSTPGSLALYLGRPFAARSVELQAEELFYGNCAGGWCYLLHSYSGLTDATDYLTGNATTVTQGVTADGTALIGTQSVTSSHNFSSTTIATH